MKKIKMTVVYSALLLIFFHYDALRTSDQISRKNTFSKKSQEAIGRERSIRTVCKWWQAMEDVYAQDSRVGIQLAAHCITKLETWEEDATAFWVFGKAVRNILFEWIERAPRDDTDEHVTIIKRSVIALYRLDQILWSRNAVFARSISKGEGIAFYDRLRDEEYQFSFETLESLAGLSVGSLLYILEDSE